MPTTPRTPPIALVSAAGAVDLDTDLPLLLGELPDAVVVRWDDPDVDWAAFGAVVVRSPWDYVTRRDEFVGWARRVDAVAALWNPSRLLEWNTDKRYLDDLAARGVPTVPTTFVAPGDPPPPLTGDVVVKPSVGAGSQGAVRFVHDPDGAVAHVAALHAEGRTAMVQPYEAAVDEVGETGLVYLGGRFSHGFRKGPILASDITWEGGLYAREEITPRAPSAAEREVADRAVAAVPPTAYARVDLLPTGDGPVLLELELTEPSLFLHLDPTAPARAAAVFRRLAAGATA